MISDLKCIQYTLPTHAGFCNRDVKAMYDISNGTPTRGLAYDPLPLWQSLGTTLYAAIVAVLLEKLVTNTLCKVPMCIHVMHYVLCKQAKAHMIV